MADTTALRLMPRVQRLRGRVAMSRRPLPLQYADIAEAAAKMGVSIRHSGMDRLAEILAALPSDQRDHVLDELAVGRPVEVSDGTTMTIFAPLDFGAAGN